MDRVDRVDRVDQVDRVDRVDQCELFEESFAWDQRINGSPDI